MDARQKYRQRLEKEANALKVIFGNTTTNGELQALIEKKKNPQPPAVIEAKATEVKSPDTSKSTPVTPVGPAHIIASQPVQLAINVPVPAINYAHPAPAWWEIVAKCKDAALYMVAGASAYALVTSRLF